MKHDVAAAILTQTIVHAFIEQAKTGDMGTDPPLVFRDSVVDMFHQIVARLDAAEDEGALVEHPKLPHEPA